MIHILTDSTADLSAECCNQLNIEVIPMYVQVNGKVYKDGEEIQASELFNTVEKTGKYPTTSAPSPSDFMKFFDRTGKSIFLGVSSMLSATIQNAKLALQTLGSHSIKIIDSLSISSGYGQIVRKAAEWRNQGMEFNELLQRIQNIVQKARGILILDNLEYLFHGGRCSAIDNFISSILRIRPFLEMRQDGTLGVLRKVHGSRTKAVQVLLDHFKTQVSSHDIRNITISHLDCDDEVAFLSDEINAFEGDVEISTANVGCVLAAHSGPKPLGIAYSLE